MAIDTTIDNAVIDFTALSSILQTLKSHDELFVQFASGSLGAIGTGDAKAKTVSTKIPADKFQIVGVSYYGTYSNKVMTADVDFGATFSASPIVVISAATTNDTKPVAYVKGKPTNTGVSIVVKDDTATSGTGVTVNILALGMKA